MTENIENIVQRVRQAHDEGQALRIVGGNSKAFYGRAVTGETLNLGGHAGIVAHEPTELYITAKAGTPLQEVEQTLADAGQMLAFEPPRCSSNSTIGGVVATGLSGPRRPYAGAARDFVLGVTCINGQGQVMSFGGQVMKNVAGYDLSRLLTGSQGTLGILLEVTLKVLPIPKHEVTCRKEVSLVEARQQLRELAGQPLPLSAVAYEGETLYLRLSGSQDIVEEALATLNMEEMSDAEAWWESLRDFTHPIFNSREDVWRLSLPVTAEPGFDNERFLMDWGGAQYWLASTKPPAELFALADELGGSATLFQTQRPNEDRFQPIPGAMMHLQRGLKQAFDPRHILNPGRMYAEL